MSAVGILALQFGYAEYQRQMGSRGHRVTASSANRRLWRSMRLPLAAEDVTYFTDYATCEATFAIDEASMLAWCSTNGWTLEPLASSSRYFDVTLVLPPDHSAVTNGFQFSPPHGRGIFDADGSRASFFVSTFP